MQLRSFGTSTYSSAAIDSHGKRMNKADTAQLTSFTERLAILSIIASELAGIN